MKIKKAMLRYYVPFVFRCENNARFKAICELCRDNFGDQSDALVSEDDFFDNISKLYKSDNNSSIGYYFNSSKIELPELISDDKAYRVKISKAGLFLNKNGIGILWYEAVPSQTIIKDEKLLIRFQNSFKELARSKSDFSWKKYSASKIKLDYIHNKNEIITDKEKITDFLSQHNFSYDPNFLEKIEKIVLKKNEKALIIQSSDTVFQTGMWIHGVLHFIEDVHYMPERIKKDNQANIPDKAILCNCIAYESDDESDLDLIFCLTHGYTNNYQQKDDFSSDLYSLFKNIYWYAAQEGMGQYFRLTDSAKDSFFYDSAFNRMTNYCYLLVLVLQQYYSLLNYSKRISALPDDKSYISAEQYQEMLLLTNGLNEFFLRNTFPQISHIFHQNNVYQYLREVYKINDFFEQVKNGLDSVVERAEMYRSEKHDDNIKLFAIIGTILGVSEVVCNTSDIISFVLGKQSADRSWFMALLTVLLGSVLLGFSIWIIWYLSKYKKRKRK